ncbi:MAG: hypothetical protein ACTSU7_00325 [Candidatus Heimdallarchaeaceae archaeon]
MKGYTFNPFTGNFDAILARDSSNFFNGTFRQHFNALVTSNGTVITLTLTNSEAGDLTCQFSTGDSSLSVPSTVELTPGSDTIPQGNYVYILESDKTQMVASTTGWPSAEHIKIGFFFVSSATYVQADGALINQNWNDGLSDGNNTGHVTHVGQWIREQGATWFSGCAGEGSDGYIDLQNGDKEMYVKVGAGIISQMHRHNFAAVDTETGPDIHIVNHPTTPYLGVHDLGTIMVDSAGGSLSGKYYNVVLGAVANKGGEYAPVMCNMPSGSYGNVNDAINDVDSYDNYDMPREFSKESSTGFYLARITIKHKTGQNTFTIENEVDLRGRKEIGEVTGGGAGGTTTEFSDSQFKIFDNLDATKIMQFNNDSITTGNTRTLTVPDADGTIALTSYVDNQNLWEVDSGETQLKTATDIDMRFKQILSCFGISHFGSYEDGTSISLNAASIYIHLWSDASYPLIITEPNISVGKLFKMNSNKITELANGTASTDAINLGQLNSAISGIDLSPYWKSDGSSTAAGNWDIGSYNLTTTGDITAGNLNISNWDTAYSWGDHASENYLKNIVEDTTPQLGGNLDSQAYDISGTGYLTMEGGATIGLPTNSAVLNGDFDDGKDEWTDAGNDWTTGDDAGDYYVYSAGGGAGTDGTLTQASTLVVGKVYRIIWDFSGTGTWNGTVSIGGWSKTAYSGNESAGSGDELFIPTNADGAVFYNGYAQYGSYNLKVSRFEVYPINDSYFGNIGAKTVVFSGLKSETNTEDLGLYSLSLGFETEASGNYSTALGLNAIASGDYAFAGGGLAGGAMGDNPSVASGAGSFAYGREARATGQSSVAMGLSPLASGSGSIALGGTATGVNSTAVGKSSQATNNYATGIGFQATASGSAACAIGSGSGVGDQPVASGTNSLALGNAVTASAPYSVAMGNWCLNNLTSTFGIGFGPAYSPVLDFTFDADTFAIRQDDHYLKLGAGLDVGMWYDGIDWIFDSQLVGTGDFHFTNGAIQGLGGFKSSDGSAGLSATHTIGGGSTGDLASITIKNGLITAVTTVP